MSMIVIIEIHQLLKSNMYSTVVTLNLKHLEIMFNYGEIIDQHTKHSTIISNFMI